MLWGLGTLRPQIWPSGGTGRHAGLKILLLETAVRVRFPPWLLKMEGYMLPGRCKAYK